MLDVRMALRVIQANRTVVMMMMMMIIIIIDIFKVA